MPGLYLSSAVGASTAGALLATAHLPLPLSAACGARSSAGGSPNSPVLREYDLVHTNVLSPAAGTTRHHTCPRCTRGNLYMAGPYMWEPSTKVIKPQVRDMVIGVLVSCAG